MVGTISNHSNLGCTIAPSLPSLLVYKSWMHHFPLTSFTPCLQILDTPLYTHFLHYLFTNPEFTNVLSLPSLLVHKSWMHHHILTSFTNCLQILNAPLYTHFLTTCLQILDAPLHTYFLHHLFTNPGCTTVYSLPSILVYKS